MSTETAADDKGVGLTVLLTLLAAAGALGMFLGAPDPVAGWAFAAAMLLGTLAVVAVHLYWD